jgi:hypothetical protein
MEEKIIRLREGEGNGTFTNVIWVSLSQNDVDGKIWSPNPKFFFSVKIKLLNLY